MRGLLVVNPRATTTNDRVRDVIVAALRAEVDLEMVVTSHQGHARELGEQARRDRLDVVITLGGDGTINETVNGMLVDGPGPDVPALATVPGGSANVLARAAGLPRDPVEATGVLLGGLHDRRYRTISLGRADGHWFTMNAGMGLDAEIIAAMESQRAAGKKASPARYLATTLNEYFRRTDRKHPAISLVRSDGTEVDHVFVCIVQNAAPWTFFGELPVNPIPEASFDEGLAVFAIRDLRVVSSLLVARRLIWGTDRVERKGLFVERDLTGFTLHADPPVALQIDGEGMGPRESVRMESVPRALRIVV
ncbi:MAG: diacylglycerol kinase family protein [Candidatus Nanopelagicales bacterium]